MTNLEVEKKHINLKDCEIKSIDTISNFNFIRKLKRKEITPFDFETHFEKNSKSCLKIEDYTHCKECHSVSIDKIDIDNLIDVEKDYHEKFNIKQVNIFSPRYQKFALIFKCNYSECIVESSPRESNPHHHSLFKNDNFSISSSIHSTKILSINNLQHEF
jgi:hypothetical protein